MPRAWLQGTALLTFLLREDPAEQIHQRTKQLIELARYARIGSPGELLGWENVDAIRFRELYSALIELAECEGSIKSTMESA